MNYYNIWKVMLKFDQKPKRERSSCSFERTAHDQHESLYYEVGHNGECTFDTPRLNEAFFNPDDMKALASTVVMGRLGRAAKKLQMLCHFSPGPMRVLSPAELYIAGGAAQV